MTSPYVWLVCGDVSPNRATVIAIYEDSADAERHKLRLPHDLLVQPALRTDGVSVRDRIWRRV